MQALAQTGLAFTRDQYDRERYQQLRVLAAQIMTQHTGPSRPIPLTSTMLRWATLRTTTQAGFIMAC